MPESAETNRMLVRADHLKASDNPTFVSLLDQLHLREARLSDQQRLLLRYLDAWQLDYLGDYRAARASLTAIIREAPDPALRFRATATLVNVLGAVHRYEDAFVQLNQLIEQLPRISGRELRWQGLGEIAQLLTAAGQYDLGASYARQMLDVIPAGETACKASYFIEHARYSGGQLGKHDPQAEEAIDECARAGESVFANALRADMASVQIKAGYPAEAAAMLEKHYASVRHDRYLITTLRFDALLAQAYLAQGQSGKARTYALAAVKASAPGEFTDPLRMACRTLYQIDQQRGDFKSALDWHRRYMEADKGYLDDVSAKALAFQIVKQQVQAKKVQVDALDKQNKILQLRQALDRKAVEASRLYIAMLALGLLAIGLWLLRLKRSQLAFMRLAQCDSLTGIFNRKHFMSEAEQVLRYVQRSARGACLVLIDLDHFKLVNDTHGHAMGDLVLRQAVTACQAHMRSTDVFGRLGGEEFGILLPECSMDSAIERAEAIRHSVAQLSSAAEPGIRISASFGVACTRETGHDLRQLLIDADQALYRAKRAGRNCVVAGKQGEGIVIA
ncbi:GGDEF domain-containing protein [Frateuria soli]|uniref:GGDEF domain-containing protein n=1 Tax=Frateuria soli TaxID=1542730 RepID=UPI001E509EB3|nr:GGDEF domain-containing protein [Frateuria soli]UGB36989.1 GGDEF domain-containing protein [Frateuria soli]